MNLTIAYVTGRKDPKIDWFLDSLRKQTWNEICPIVIVISRHELYLHAMSWPKLVVSKPKPNVWQGEHRLTKEDWWAMSNARNTALALCKTDYLCYVDDLSVLMPGWFDAVKEAMAGNYIACGAYRKVKKLVVENGEVKSYEPYSEDTRFALAKDTVSPCTGDWLYGCSCCFPVEALLTVGGWPEICDGLGSEDYCLGIALQNAGFHLKYDKRMMTYEDEDLHNTTVGSDTQWGENGVRVSGGLKRMDKGISPNDKSHAVLGIARSSRYYANYYEGGMRRLREHVLSGNPFPVIQQPQHDWFDGQPISEM